MSTETKEAVVKLISNNINPFKGIEDWSIKGGPNFEYLLHYIGTMGRKEAEKWCVDRGYTLSNSSLRSN